MGSLRIEGFDGGIRGHRSLMIGKEADWLARVAVLESESLYKGRSILVIQESGRGGGGGVGAAMFRKRWDCVFRIREQFETQMLMTYVANAPKPLRIVWTSAAASASSSASGLASGASGSTGNDIPRALWSRWDRADITLLGCSRGGEMLGCEWETIFFPLQNTSQFTERILSMRGSGIKNLAGGVGEHLAEIAANGAALVWSNIDEKDARGALYWYDPSEGVGAEERISKGEVVAMLEEIKGWVA